jgi:hypothetical protein
MERLFLPGILESRGRLERFRRRHPEPLQELDLDVSTEELLSAERALTYADLYAILGNEDTLAWLTPHAAIAREYGNAMRYWEQLDGSCGFSFSADGKKIIAFAHSHEHLSEICDVVIRLLAASAVQSVRLNNWSSLDRLFISATTLEYLMGQCQSLQVLTLVDLSMNENHIRVLGAYSRPDLEIELDRCTITSAGANTLAEVLGRNQGPTKLNYCEIDNLVLANGLRGNSRLKSLTPCISYNFEIGNRELLEITGALRENKGLVYLDLGYGRLLSDETWGAFCDSLKTHPTLEVLNLRGAFPDTASAPAVIKPRMQALVDIMKVNMSIHTIHLDAQYSERDLFRRSVIPYLETNRIRPRLLAIQQTRPIPYRAKVLGRALLSVRTDANSFWMLLSGNAEVAFPSTTATIAATGNLTTAATAAATATSTANLAVTALATTATDSLLTPAAETATISAATPSNDPDVLAFAPTVATAAAAAAPAVNAAAPSPSAGQKRKAHL